MLTKWNIRSIIYYIIIVYSFYQYLSAVSGYILFKYKHYCGVLYTLYYLICWDEIINS